MSSDPLFPCCQSSVAGTSCFGIRSHAWRYSDLMIPSSLKLLARMHCRDLALMRRRRGSTRGYAHSEDLETGVRRSGATDRRADGATTRALQPPL